MALTILPYNDRGPSRSQRMAKDLKGAFEKGVEIYEKREEDKALKDKYGIDLKGIKDPDTRSQIIAQELQYGRKMKQAEKSAGINYATGQRDTGREPTEIKETKKNLPEFGEVNGMKKNRPPQQLSTEGGSIPQSETQGEKRPVLPPEQVFKQGQQIAQLSRESGIPMSDEQGFERANMMNTENKNYNHSVDMDLAKRVESQERYGGIAVESLLKVLPNATDEQQSILRKYGEEAATEGKSEADIRKSIALKARDFKNTIANVSNSIGPKRLFSGAKSAILGTSREDEKEKTGIRIKLKPLLDQGLYGTARNLLSELGYHPEEREAIISDLPEGANKIMASFPKIDRPYNSHYGLEPLTKRPYTEKEIGQIGDAVNNVFKTDPSTNLVLFRKSMEDKGADWEVFKDALDKGILEGTIKLNDDQFSQLDLMDQPPLDNLDKILHGLKLIGR